MNAMHYAAIHESGGPLRWLGQQGGDAALRASCAQDQVGAGAPRSAQRKRTKPHAASPSTPPPLLCCPARAAYDQHGRTPLHVAVQWGGEDAVVEAAALARRADSKGTALSARDAVGRTSLGLCLRLGRTRAAARLIRAAPEALEAEVGDAGGPPRAMQT